MHAVERGVGFPALVLHQTNPAGGKPPGCSIFRRVPDMNTTAGHRAPWHAGLLRAAMAVGALLVLAAGAPARAATAAPAPAASGAAAAPGTAGPHGLAGRTARQKTPPVAVERIDINSANLKQLMTLPGIGQAEARKIIANRPYLSKAELVQKGVLPVGPYVSLKDRIIALQKKPLKARP